MWRQFRKRSAKRNLVRWGRGGGQMLRWSTTRRTILRSAIWSWGLSAVRQAVAQDERGTEEFPTKCSSKFLSGRRDAAWYEATAHFGQKGPGCETSKAVSKDVTERSAIPIWWYIVGDKSKSTDVAPRLQEAKAWFQKYCIKTPFYEISSTKEEKIRWGRKLSTANDADAYPG
jgi:hypothetical protein